MSSENPSGADNQQETGKSREPLDPFWVVGFVDGEGCCSVSIHSNPRYARRSRGFQVNAVFHVYQHKKDRAVLAQLVDVFGCGKIRAKGGGSNVLTFAVDRLVDLEERVLPFFETYPLRVKAHDFAKFAVLVRALRRGEHLTPQGFERLVRLAYSMNGNGKQRRRTLEEVLSGSSETARQAPANPPAKIQSDPYGDIGSQAEMTWPPSPQPSGTGR